MRGDESVAAIGLPAGIVNSLRQAEVATLSDLCKLSSPELLAVRNIGPKSLAEIRRRLWLRDHWLADGRWGDP